MEVSEDGRWSDGRCLTLDAERLAMRVAVASPPWMYRRMVDGSMVAGRWLALDAEHLAAWRWVVSEFEEETRSCLIQTGASFSSNLKHGSMPAW